MTKTQKIDAAILQAEVLLDALKDIKNAIIFENAEHYPTLITRSPKNLKKIVEISCTCGEVTRYKVPLTDIEDFVCPKDEGRN